MMSASNQDASTPQALMVRPHLTRGGWVAIPQ